MTTLMNIMLLLGIATSIYALIACLYAISLLRYLHKRKDQMTNLPLILTATLLNVTMWAAWIAQTALFVVAGRV